MKSIGKQIASLRKEKGIRQEELANYVGVSAQAVSKWENGGVPDIDLLPKISDYFGVSIDALFDRDITDYSDLKAALTKKIIETPSEKRMSAGFELCWVLERALFGKILEDDGIEEYKAVMGENEQLYSSIINDFGFTRMGIANRLHYFLLMPEPRDADVAFFNGIDYPSFFKDFSDKDVFDACLMLNRRDSKATFTGQLLEEKLKFSKEKSKEVLGILKKYNMVYEKQLELNDEMLTVYVFEPTPSFIALLVFAREIIDTPRDFAYNSQGRKKPFFPAGASAKPSPAAT